jgi:hypothetical protein
MYIYIMCTCIYVTLFCAHCLFLYVSPHVTIISFLGSKIVLCAKKLLNEARHQWLMTVILATLDADIRRITVWGQPWAKIYDEPILTNSWAQWCTLVISATAGSAKQDDHVPASQGRNTRSYPKAAREQKAGGMALLKFTNSLPSS